MTRKFRWLFAALFVLLLQAVVPVSALAAPTIPNVGPANDGPGADIAWKLLDYVLLGAFVFMVFLVVIGLAMIGRGTLGKGNHAGRGVTTVIVASILAGIIVNFSPFVQSMFTFFTVT